MLTPGLKKVTSRLLRQDDSSGEVARTTSSLPQSQAGNAVDIGRKVRANCVLA
jgi:hypothetical protein